MRRLTHQRLSLPFLYLSHVWKFFVTASLFMVFFAQNSQAQVAWGYACGSQQQSPFTSGSMYDINLSTGAGTLLGQACGGGSPSLFAGEFIGGTFYALDNNGPTLVTVANDGSCTLVGNVTGITAGHTVTGLSHDLSSGITYALSTNTVATDLYTINIATGSANLIGSIAGVAAGISLAIDENGNAYVIEIDPVVAGKVHKVNLANANPIGPGVNITDGVNNIPLNNAQDADFDCGTNGVIQGVLVNGASFSVLGTLNPTTGVFTQTATLGQEICAFSVNCGAAVPTMGTWALLILALSLLSLGLVFIQRKQLVLAGAFGQYRQPSATPFHAAAYAKALVLVLATVLTLFAVAIWSFGYELTSADLPGALIASPIAAYLLHLIVKGKE